MSTTHYSAPGPPQPGAYEFVRIDRAASSNGTMHARAVQHGTGCALAEASVFATWPITPLPHHLRQRHIQRRHGALHDDDALGAHPPYRRDPPLRVASCPPLLLLNTPSGSGPCCWDSSGSRTCAIIITTSSSRHHHPRPLFFLAHRPSGHGSSIHDRDTIAW
jgi:hypothetical protein